MAARCSSQSHRWRPARVCVATTTDSLAGISFSFRRATRELTRSHSGSLPLKCLLLSSKVLLLLLLPRKRTVWGVYVCLNTGWLVIAAAVPNNSYKHEDACCNYVSVCVLYACLQTVSTILWWVLLHSPALVFPLGGVANIQTPPSAPSDPFSTPPLIVPECSRGKRS